MTFSCHFGNAETEKQQQHIPSWLRFSLREIGNAYFSLLFPLTFSSLVVQTPKSALIAVSFCSVLLVHYCQRRQQHQQRQQHRTTLHTGALRTKLGATDDADDAVAAIAKVHCCCSAWSYFVSLSIISTFSPLLSVSVSRRLSAGW